MSVSRILDGLEHSNATGREADKVARLGFLEWVFSSPDAATPQAVRNALNSAAARDPGSAAARAFVGFLRQAAQPVCHGHVRRRRLRRLN